MSSLQCSLILKAPLAQNEIAFQKKLRLQINKRPLDIIDLGFILDLFSFIAWWLVIQMETSLISARSSIWKETFVQKVLP